MILDLPRKLPADLVELLVKADLISHDNIEKHLTIISYWRSIFSRFDPEENPDELLAEVQKSSTFGSGLELL